MAHLQLCCQVPAESVCVQRLHCEWMCVFAYPGTLCLCWDAVLFACDAEVFTPQLW